jgi:hypothetical protein
MSAKPRDNASIGFAASLPGPIIFAASSKLTQDAKEARKSVVVATGFIGYFYLLTFIIGFGAILFVSNNPQFLDNETCRNHNRFTRFFCIFYSEETHKNMWKTRCTKHECQAKRQCINRAFMVMKAVGFSFSNMFTQSIEVFSKVHSVSFEEA